MQQQDNISNRIDTIAKALLRFVKENDVKIAELNKQIKELEGKVDDMKKEVREISETNKKMSKDIEKIQDAVKDGFYELKAKIGSSLYEMKKEEKEEEKKDTSVRDMISKLKDSGYERE